MSGVEIEPTVQGTDRQSGTMAVTERLRPSVSRHMGRTPASCLPPKLLQHADSGGRSGSSVQLPQSFIVLGFLLASPTLSDASRTFVAADSLLPHAGSRPLQRWRLPIRDLLNARRIQRRFVCAKRPRPDPWARAQHTPAASADIPQSASPAEIRPARARGGSPFRPP